MKWRDLISNVPVIEPTGCVRCDGLRKATNNRVRFCLRHDKTISAEWRAKFDIPLEELPSKQGELYEST